MLLPQLLAVNDLAGDGNNGESAEINSVVDDSAIQRNSLQREKRRGRKAIVPGCPSASDHLLHKYLVSLNK